jgi:6-phosphogluconolactonase
LAVYSPSLSEEKAVVSNLLHGFSPVRPAGVGGLLALAFALACSSAAAAERLIWIGASAGTPRIDGIYAARFDDAAGTISPPTRVAAVLNPWSLEVHPALPVLYAAAAVSEGGRIESYMIDPGTGGLKPLGSLPGVASTLAVDPAGKRLFAASAIGSTVSCHAIADDGVPQPPGKSGRNLCRYGVEETDKERRKQPGYFRSRQLKPGMTAIAVAADGRFVVACDLGLDKVFVVATDATEPTITPHKTIEVGVGNGPRRFAWHPSGRFAYVANELDNSVTALAFDAQAGTLTVIDTTASLPADVDESFRRRHEQQRTFAMDVTVEPSGRFLYVANAGHDSVAEFAIDAATGKPTFAASQPTRGTFPVALAVAPGGRHLLVATHRSGGVEVMAIDDKTGRLSATKTAAEIPAPACIRFR